MPTPSTHPETHIEDNDKDTRRLATSEGLGSVTLCGCGTLSLNVQSLSLRLDMTAFAQLLVMCGEAMDVLEALARLKAGEPLQPAPELIH